MSSNTVLERLNSYKDTGLEIPANHVEVGQQPDGEKKYSFNLEWFLSLQNTTEDHENTITINKYHKFG